MTTSNAPQDDSTPDTAEAKIREIVEYCAESYYPEHEYGDSHAKQNKEYLEEAVQQLKGLLVDARLIELDLLEQAINQGRDMYQYKMQRLAALQQTRQEEVRE